MQIDLDFEVGRIVVRQAPVVSLELLLSHTMRWIYKIDYIFLPHYQVNPNIETFE